MKKRRISLLIIGAIMALAALFLFSGLMMSNALFRTKHDVGGDVDYAPVVSQDCNVTFVVDGVEQEVVTVPANQPVGSKFPVNEENCCGYYLNENYTGLVEADSILTEPTLKLYTATATPNLTFSPVAGGYSVSASSTSDTNYVIPLKYNSEYVNALAESAFRYCLNLTSVTIPESVTIIGHSAFDFCSKLASITIPSSVTFLGEVVFQNCVKLTEITIPEGVTSIGQNAFYSCRNLTSITIPSSVTSIGHSAFSNCRNLTSITIPSSVTSIGSDAFYGCLDELFTISNNGKYLKIGEGADLALINTTSTTLTSFEINAMTRIIAGSAFQNCSTLPSITIPEGVTSIPSYAFQGCSSLTSITIPSSVTSIGERAFNNCPDALFTISNNGKYLKIGEGPDLALIDTTSTTLSSFEINSSTRIIAGGAFQGCSGLTSITIPSSVTGIGSTAFSGCSGLTSISVMSGNTRYISSGNCLIETTSKKLIKGCNNSEIPKGVISICDDAFSGCSGLTSVTIPYSVTNIGIRAFLNCVGLNSIEVERGNTKYHSSGNCLIETATKILIQGCNNSEIPNNGSVTKISGAAFKGYAALTSITIPEGVTDIESYAFQDCTGLQSISIPSSVNRICDWAFAGCSNLTSITFEKTSDWIAIGYDTFTSALISVNFSGKTWTSGGTTFTGTLSGLSTAINKASQLNSGSPGSDTMKHWQIS